MTSPATVSKAAPGSPTSVSHTQDAAFDEVKEQQRLRQESREPPAAGAALEHQVMAGSEDGNVGHGVLNTTGSSSPSVPLPSPGAFPHAPVEDHTTEPVPSAIMQTSTIQNQSSPISEVVTAAATSDAAAVATAAAADSHAPAAASSLPTESTTPAAAVLFVGAKEKMTNSSSTMVLPSSSSTGPLQTVSESPPSSNPAEPSGSLLGETKPKLAPVSKTTAAAAAAADTIARANPKRSSVGSNPNSSSHRSIPRHVPLHVAAQPIHSLPTPPFMLPAPSFSAQQPPAMPQAVPPLPPSMQTAAALQLAAASQQQPFFSPLRGLPAHMAAPMPAQIAVANQGLFPLPLFQNLPFPMHTVSEPAAAVAATAAAGGGGGLSLGGKRMGHHHHHQAAAVPSLKHMAGSSDSRRISASQHVQESSSGAQLAAATVAAALASSASASAARAEGGAAAAAAAGLTPRLHLPTLLPKQEGLQFPASFTAASPGASFLKPAADPRAEVPGAAAAASEAPLMIQLASEPSGGSPVDAVGNRGGFHLSSTAAMVGRAGGGERGGREESAVDASGRTAANLGVAEQQKGQQEVVGQQQGYALESGTAEYFTMKATSHSRLHLPSAEALRVRQQEASLVVAVDGRKVRLQSEDEPSSLYSLCRCWLFNSSRRKRQQGAEIEEAAAEVGGVSSVEEPNRSNGVDEVNVLSSAVLSDEENISHEAPLDGDSTELLQHHLENFKMKRRRILRSKQKKMADARHHLSKLLSRGMDVPHGVDIGT